jgi:hypothetical protein
MGRAAFWFWRFKKPRRENPDRPTGKFAPHEHSEQGILAVHLLSRGMRHGEAR